jgi:hypothetical protein
MSNARLPESDWADAWRFYPVPNHRRRPAVAHRVDEWCGHSGALPVADPRRVGCTPLLRPVLEDAV